MSLDSNSLRIVGDKTDFHNVPPGEEASDQGVVLQAIGSAKSLFSSGSLSNILKLELSSRDCCLLDIDPRTT